MTGREDTIACGNVMLSRLKVGDRLIADGNFTCLKRGQIVTVQAAARSLWVHCKDGAHYLDGRLGDGGRLVGFKRAPALASIFATEATDEGDTWNASIMSRGRCIAIIYADTKGGCTRRAREIVRALLEKRRRA